MNNVWRTWFAMGFLKMIEATCSTINIGCHSSSAIVISRIIYYWVWVCLENIMWKIGIKFSHRSLLKFSWTQASKRNKYYSYCLHSSFKAADYAQNVELGVRFFTLNVTLDWSLNKHQSKYYFPKHFLTKIYWSKECRSSGQQSNLSTSSPCSQ